MLAMLSLAHFGLSKYCACRSTWVFNLASIRKEEGTNEPTSFRVWFQPAFDWKYGKIKLTFSDIPSVACNMLKCWHPAVHNEAPAASLAATTGQAKLPFFSDACVWFENTEGLPDTWRLGGWSSLRLLSFSFLISWVTWSRMLQYFTVDM